MTNLFERRAAPGRGRTVKAWVTEQLDLAEADVVAVAELACHEPGCPPLETVVSVHGSDGQRRAWHIHKPLADIEQTDIVTALAEENGD